MTEHRGSSFAHSCIKVPVDPFSRQPTPSYERPRIQKLKKRSPSEKSRRINFVQTPSHRAFNCIETGSSDDSNLDSFLEFLDSIPDYEEVHHLSNEQFKQKLDYLKRKQCLLLKNLENCSDHDIICKNKDQMIEDKSPILPTISIPTIPDKSRKWNDTSDLKLLGKKCSLEDSRTDSPFFFCSDTFSGLAQDQDFLTYRCKDKDKAMKTLSNREIHSAGKSSSLWSESKSESGNSGSENSAETRSLPPSSPKRWHPTVPKSFPLALRADLEEYMLRIEAEVDERFKGKNKCGSEKKKRARPIPLTSRIPLYDKLMAAKEERSRIIREESAWCLMSKIKPFRLECDRRAIKVMSRSIPELTDTKMFEPTSRFKAKPVPKKLFGTEVYDQMLEDEYFRLLRKKVRAAELMKSSSLPPSMARRERIKSACIPCTRSGTNDELLRDKESLRMCSATPAISGRSTSAMTDLSTKGSNLAAILRFQSSREKLQKKIQESMEEKARECAIRMKESMISRKPEWRALRHTARKEQERDLDFRASLRKDEAREQAERHRLEMEMMLNRVTQIPTLFERQSQKYQSMRQLQFQASKLGRRKRTHKPKFENSSSLESDDCTVRGQNSRPDSGSFTNTSILRLSPSQSSESSDSRKPQRSTRILGSFSFMGKKKSERGPMKVSINETAELIENRNDDQDDDDDDDDNDRYTSHSGERTSTCNNNDKDFEFMNK